MKTFLDLKIGDDIYVLNYNFDITPVRIDGIRNISLKNEKIELYTFGRSSGPIIVDAYNTKCKSDKDRYGRDNHTTYFSCLDAAQEARNNLRSSFIDDQYYIAKRAFNQIKKFSPNDERLKKRIFDFFNIDH